MLRPPLRLILLLAFAAAFAACDSGNDDSGDNNGNGNGGNSGGESSLTATVDGEAFEAATFFAEQGEGSRDDEFIIIGRTGGMPIESIELSVPTAEGTYDLGPGQNAGGFYSISEPFSQFSTAIGGDGTITLSGVSDDRLTGTFTFTAPRFTGPDERQAVTATGGTFDVRRTD